MSEPLSSGDFELLREYLRRTAGLEFDEARRQGLASIVAARLVSCGVPTVSAYVAGLELPGGLVERQRLLDDVTIQETHFHRARPQIDALRDQILPDIIMRAAREDREVVVWSAGCSTGEEPFTLAMLMLEVAAKLPLLTRPKMRVVGSDVSTAALRVATSATYSGRTIDLAEPEAVARWLQREPDGTYVVKDEVRELVSFVHNNMIADLPPFKVGAIDLIVCRHVTIYFSRETTRALIDRFRTVVAPEGWLLMGPAESLWQVSDAFTLAAVGNAFAYRAAVPGAVPGVGPEVTHRLPAPRPIAPVRPADPVRRSTAAAGLRSVLPLRRTVSTAPKLTAFDLAQADFDLGRYDKAAAQCQAIVDANPVSPAAYVLLGHALLNEGDAPGAVGPLQKAVYLEPQAGHAHFLLAVALSTCGRSAQAGPSYRAAAVNLPTVAPEMVRRLLDGRKMSELVQLCRRLADAAEGAHGAQDAGVTAASANPAPAPVGRGT